MELYRLTERVWYTSYEEERDRPALGYIKGDKFSVAIDAGHSDAHLNEFYDLLRKENLPLPSLTIITHWHWDHSFAMHCINGISIANEKTNEYLKDFIKNRSSENDWKFLNLDPSIMLEYSGGREIKVVPADVTFKDKLSIDAGNEKIELFRAVSPHTDDATFTYLPEEKVLFIGDAISGVFPTRIADKDKTREQIRLFEEMDLNWIVGGHWEKWDKQGLIDYLKHTL